MTEQASCQSCGTPSISLEAQQASVRLATLPEPALEVLRTNFGAVPTALCAACFLPSYAHAIANG